MVPKRILTPYGAKTMSIVPMATIGTTYDSIVRMVPKRDPFWHHMVQKYILAPYGASW